MLRSDGSMIRDYIYVRDVVLAYLALAEKMEDTTLHGHAFNFSTEQPLSVIDLVHRILTAASREDLQPTVLGEATNEIPAQHLSAAKARKMLGWSPAYTLETGLSETVDWYREWLARQKATS